MNWIPISKRLPTKEDAGDWKKVAVLSVMRVGGTEIKYPVLLLPEEVGEPFCSYWAPLPPRPEEEPAE